MSQETGSVINVMKRYELKYLPDRGQTAWLISRLKGHMEPDRYGLTTIASLYYDTPDRRLIRASLEKPEFKEKLRLRSYGPATEASPVFLELKRKASGIVPHPGERGSRTDSGLYRFLRYGILRIQGLL